MKKFAVAIGVVAGLIAPSAFAADMGVPSAPPMAAPIYNWTGFYIGVNAGASMGSVKTDYNIPSTEISSFISVLSSTDRFTQGFGGSDTSSPSGFIGGGQIGYNWQYSPLIVVGLEADFQGALEEDNRSVTNTFTATGTSCAILVGCIAASHVSVSSALDYQTKIDWFGTARARLGYVWGNGQVMSYVTGGFAYGKVSIDGTIGTAASGFASVNQAFSASNINTGWVVGYGNEGALDFWGAHNWTWRVETLYMDLGHLNATAPGASASTSGSILVADVILPTGTTTTAGPVSSNSHFTDWILRGGLSYRF